MKLQDMIPGTYARDNGLLVRLTGKPRRISGGTVVAVQAIPTGYAYDAGTINLQPAPKFSAAVEAYRRASRGW